MRHISKKWIVPLTVFFGALSITTAFAQSPSEIFATQATNQATSTEEKPFDLAEKTENIGRLYKNDKNDTLQELWFLGRYHGQYHWTEASTGETDFYETRRFRLGAQAKMLRKLTMHVQMVSGSDIDPFYNGFTELWIQWAFTPEVAFSIGQQKNRFTHDRNVSSRYLNYLERAMLTNMFNVDYTPSATLQGKVDKLTYYTGFFTNATGRDIGEAFVEFDSGYSYIAQVYYDLGKALGADSATLYGSYINSDANQNATNMNYFDNGVSSAVILTKGHTSLVTEVTGGFGNENGNAVGLNLQPSYFINQKWQLATRYQLAGSNGQEGLNPQKRYEKPSGFEPGDLYQAGYFGVDYYIARHRLKLMNGIEYSNMSGQEAWTASSMIRLFWGPQSPGAFPANQVLPLEPD